MVEFDAPTDPTGSDVEGRAEARLTLPNGDVMRLRPVSPFEPTVAELADYSGTYRSEEAESTYGFVVEEDTLVRVDRYGSKVRLVPAYPDAFTGRGTVYLFRRDAAGRVDGLSLSQSRVWDMWFERVR